MDLLKLVASLGFAAILLPACASTPPPEPAQLPPPSREPAPLTATGSPSSPDPLSERDNTSNRTLQVAGGETSTPANGEQQAPDHRTDCQRLRSVITQEAGKLSAALKATDLSNLNQAALEIDASALTVKAVRLRDPNMVRFRDRQATFFNSFATHLRNLNGVMKANDKTKAKSIQADVLQTIKDNKGMADELDAYCANH